MQVALCPQSYLHALRAGVVAKLSQVFYIAVERARLSVTRSIAIVRQKPSQRHVVVHVAVDGGTRRELVVVLLAVKALLRASVVLLALLVHLAVLKHHSAVLVLLPVVAVVGVEMTLVESELRHKYWMARKLIEVVEQLHGRLVEHDEHVEIILRVLQAHLARLVVSKVVASRTERVPHHAISARAPVERSRRSHASVNPAVCILYSNALASMRETSVLHASAIKVLTLVLSKAYRCVALVNLGRRKVLHNRLARSQVHNVHVARMLVDVQADGRRCDLQRSVHINGADVSRQAAGKLGKNLGRRRSHGVAHHPTLVVAEQAHDIVAIKVDGKLSSVGIVNLNCVRINLCHVLHGKGLVGLNCRLFHSQSRAQWNGLDALWHKRHSSQGDRHDKSNRRISGLLRFVVFLHFIVFLHIVNLLLLVDFMLIVGLVISDHTKEEHIILNS